MAENVLGRHVAPRTTPQEHQQIDSQMVCLLPVWILGPVMFRLKALFVAFELLHYPRESPRGEMVIDFLYTVFIN